MILNNGLGEIGPCISLPVISSDFHLCNTKAFDEIMRPKMGIPGVQL